MPTCREKQFGNYYWHQGGDKFAHTEI